MSRREIPMTSPLSPSMFLKPRRDHWRKAFPFSEPFGHWTYKARIALYHGLDCLGLPPGSTVLVPAYHEGIEIDTLLAAGYKICYYRVTDQLQIDLQDVERRLDKNCKAFYIIHYNGFPQDMASLQSFCAKHNLKLIEDCALALFSKNDQTWLGSYGDLAIFSIHKSLFLPCAGFFVTKANNSFTGLSSPPAKATVIQTLELLRLYVRSSRCAILEQWLTRAKRLFSRYSSVDMNDPFKPELEWDPKMIPFGASAWSVFLIDYVNPEKIIEQRRANYHQLVSHLKGRASLPQPELPDGVCPLFLPVLLENKLLVKKGMARNGVQSISFWSKSHLTCPADLAQEMAGWRDNCLALPIHQDISEEQIITIGDSLLNQI